MGRIPHTRDSLHDCRSVTKSIVSACVGIAIAQGKIKSIDDKVFSYFPDYKQYATGAKEGLAIKDLLTMTAGLDWNERMPYADPANCERQMLDAQDITDFVLKRKSVAAPGTVWNYSGGCTQLLAQIVLKATGMPINVFVDKYLFTPLGIARFNWTVRADGIVWTPSRLRLRPIDMVKIGQLYMQEGRWKGQQLIPAGWGRQSMRWCFNTDEANVGYGYQFWCGKPVIAGQPADVTHADGNGGQMIVMAPSQDLEVVLTAGNYDENGDTSYDVLVNNIFAAVR